ncbi:hypothetical protein GH714_013829 [Hevea brasiliensis]|uniref:LOB domain-containing protein n=1 Tax=Hevea brasiliensis TaxID=3981 RepID=A0A6A6K4N0_HEVBR|nr:hypothetical protein GH714_013829 [Hevea brasiliensis]
MSTPNSPCAACKFLRRKCTQECVFAPYFPPDQPQKFANVHKVFGASNVAKLLNELNTVQREDAVNSLAYEAEARLHDPVYGCVGLISILQHRLKELQSDLFNAKKELAQYIGSQAMLPTLQSPAYMPHPHLGNPNASSLMQHGALPMMGIPSRPTNGGQLMIRETQQQQQQQHQNQFFEAQQLAAALAITVAAISPSLALGSFDTPYQVQPQQVDHHQHHQLQAQLFLQPQPHEQQQHSQQTHQQHQPSGSDEGGSIGLTC